MARVEGIRAPVVIDMSDIPRSMKAIEAEFMRLKKKVGEVDFRIDGRYLRDFSRKGLQPLIKDFKNIEDEAKNAAARVNRLGAAIKKVREGGKFSDAQFDEIGAMKGVGQKTQTAMMGYQGVRASLHADPGNVELQKEMEASQKRVIQLLQNARNLNQRIINQKKQQLEVVLRTSTYQNRFDKQFQAATKSSLERWRLLYIKTKRQKASLDEIIELHKLKNRLIREGVKFSQKHHEVMKRTARIARKAEAAKGGLMGQGLAGRIKWFAQLRVLWGVLRVVSSLTEAMMELDNATSRAMRTMVRGGKDYDKVSKQVRQTILDLSRMTGASYKDIGEALYQLSSAGLEASEAMAAVNSVVKLATVTESDMTDTTKVVAGAFNNFRDNIRGAQTDTEKFAKISGTLSYVWERNQIDMNELVQGLNQSAQSAKLGGLEFGELAVILGNLGTRMIRSGRAGRMFRSAIINIAKKSEEVKETFDITFDPAKPMDFLEIMDKMHAKWKDSKKTVQATRAVFDIFGKRGGPAMVAMLDSWEKIRAEMGGVNSALDLAVAQHEKMLMTQTHYKQLTEALHKETIAFVIEYFDYMKFIKGIVDSMRETMMGGRVAKQSQKTVAELTETYKDSGQVMERLVEVTAHRNKLLKEGVEETEPVIKSHNRLIGNLTELMELYKLSEGAYDGMEQEQKKAAMTQENLARGMELANIQIRDWNIESGKAKLTQAELSAEINRTKEALERSKQNYAEYYAQVAGGVAEKNPAIEAEMKRLNQLYNKLTAQLEKLKDEEAKMADKKTKELEKQAEKEKQILQMRQDARLNAQMMAADTMGDESDKLDAQEQIELEKAELEYQRQVEKYGRLEELEEQHQAKLIAIQNKYSKQHEDVDKKKSEKKKQVYSGEYSELVNLGNKYERLREEECNRES